MNMLTRGGCLSCRLVVFLMHEPSGFTYDKLVLFLLKSSNLSLDRGCPSDPELVSDPQRLFNLLSHDFGLETNDSNYQIPDNSH